VAELATLAQRFPRVHPPLQVLDGYLRPPTSPAECIFAQGTLPFRRPRDAHYAVPVRGPAGLFRMGVSGVSGYDCHRAP
jgi:hypothetical protein